MTKMKSLDNGLDYFKSFGCDMKVYNEEDFEAKGCVDYSARKHYMPIDWYETSISRIRCSINCTASYQYKNFSSSIGFDGSKLDQWRYIEHVVVAFLDQYTYAISSDEENQGKGESK